MRFVLYCLVLLAGMAAPAQAVTVVGDNLSRVASPEQMEDALRRVALVDGHGRRFDLAAVLDNGKPTLITLWAHWCAVCQSEMPGFRDLARQCGDALNVVFISSRPSDFPSDLKRYGGYGLTWPMAGIDRRMLADSASYSIYQAFSGATRDGSVVTPLHYFVAADGRLDTILFTGVDFSTPDSIATACGR